MGLVDDVKVICTDCGTSFYFYREGKKDIKTELNIFNTWNSRASAWISVKDRLPERSCECLTYQFRSGEYHVIEYWAAIDMPRGIKKSGWNMDHEMVTHWQPLPAPPEADHAD